MRLHLIHVRLREVNGVVRLSGELVSAKYALVRVAARNGEHLLVI